MPQFSVTQNAIPAQPGMAFDSEASNRDVVSCVCAVNIPFGVYCELNSSGQAVPMKDATTGGSFLPLKLGISLFDPLGSEQQYVTWSVPATAAGTANVVNNATGVTFSSAQTLAQGAPLVFSSQPGVQYFLAQALVGATAAQLTSAYTGPSNGAATVTLPGLGSSNVGWEAGKAAPFMRRGRIWVAGDASGSSTQTGPINLHHSSTGTNPQGVFTYLAVSAASGNEIDIAPGCLGWNVGLQYNGQYTDPFGNVFSIYPVEIDI
jgi:hypothetical protein